MSLTEHKKYMFLIPSQHVIVGIDIWGHYFTPNVAWGKAGKRLR